jgi:DNA-binding MarR family transcriptional regulator
VLSDLAERCLVPRDTNRLYPFRRTIIRQTMKKAYTDKQGQYLAFIYCYGKIHGCAPSEAELQQYFRVSPPSVHQMILTLEARGLIGRTPGQARSIHLLIRPEELPDLA